MKFYIDEPSLIIILNVIPNASLDLASSLKCRLSPAKVLRSVCSVTHCDHNPPDGVMRC